MRHVPWACVSGRWLIAQMSENLLGDIQTTFPFSQVDTDFPARARCNTASRMPPRRMASVMRCMVREEFRSRRSRLFSHLRASFICFHVVSASMNSFSRGVASEELHLFEDFQAGYYRRRPRYRPRGGRAERSSGHCDDNAGGWLLPEYRVLPDSPVPLLGQPPDPGLANQKYTRWTLYPAPRSDASQGADVRPARVVSNAKLARCSARERRRSNMSRLAVIAILSGSNPDNPWAMTSAFTNVIRRSVFAASRVLEAVVFPAPFGPARITTCAAGNVIRQVPAGA